MYKINDIRLILKDKFGLSLSVDQIRKLEKRGLYSFKRSGDGKKNKYRVIDDEKLRIVVKAILLYYFNTPLEVIQRNSAEELKPYIKQIHRAVKMVKGN